MLSNEVVVFAFFLILALVVGWIYFSSQSARTTREQIRRVAEQHTIISTDEHARELCLAVHQLYPLVHAGVDFMIKRDDPDKPAYLADWYASAPKPTPEQLDAALSRIANKDLAALRRAEYPSVGDQLDAAYQARHGDTSAQEHIDAKIREVKEKYQKPGESSY
jgi:hypothetical protein